MKSYINDVIKSISRLEEEVNNLKKLKDKLIYDQSKYLVLADDETFSQGTDPFKDRKYKLLKIDGESLVQTIIDTPQKIIDYLFDNEVLDTEVYNIEIIKPWIELWN